MNQCHPNKCNTNFIFLNFFIVVQLQLSPFPPIALVNLIIFLKNSPFLKTEGNKQQYQPIDMTTMFSIKICKKRRLNSDELFSESQLD